mmetsp:Transcript_22561/g.50049  ORF Transcript_22561/g.50049 Transcript_22561/m.50049 type:complete len:281 (-) Transcript_22561:142-984(-)
MPLLDTIVNVERVDLPPVLPIQGNDGIDEIIIAKKPTMKKDKAKKKSKSKKKLVDASGDPVDADAGNFEESSSVLHKKEKLKKKKSKKAKKNGSQSLLKLIDVPDNIDCNDGDGDDNGEGDCDQKTATTEKLSSLIITEDDSSSKKKKKKKEKEKKAKKEKKTKKEKKDRSPSPQPETNTVDVEEPPTWWSDPDDDKEEEDAATELKPQTKVAAPRPGLGERRNSYSPEFLSFLLSNEDEMDAEEEARQGSIRDLKKRIGKLKKKNSLKIQRASERNLVV